MRAAAALVLFLSLVGCDRPADGGVPDGKADPLADHPWWKGKVAPAKLDALLKEIGGVSRSFVVFNPTGAFVTVPMSGGPAPLGAHPWEEVIAANAVAGDPLKKLPKDWRMVAVAAPAGERVDAVKARRFVEDALRAKTWNEFQKQVDDEWDGFFNRSKKKDKD